MMWRLTNTEMMRKEIHKILFQNVENQLKMRFFLMSQGSFSPKIRFLGQKVCSVARGRTDTQVKTEDTLSRYQAFFLQPYHQVAVQVYAVFIRSYKSLNS